MTEPKRKLSTLIKEVKNGNTEALEELYERFLPLIKNRAKKMGFDYQEDAKNELLVELLEAVKRFEPKTDWGKKEFKKHIKKYK